jgi:PKD repeat protein
MVLGLRFLVSLLLPLAATPAYSDCTLTNTGIVPLSDLGLTFYKGFGGGLYPNGANSRPPSHLQAGVTIATNQIVPRQSNGTPDTVNGKIVLLSSGMSNTTQEWASKGTNTFYHLVTRDLSHNPQLVVVDGAIGGEDAKQWTNINAPTWNTVLTQRLPSAGVTTNQVQIMWLKQAIANETGALTDHAILLQSQLEQIVRNAKILFPNLKMVFLSSRTRAYVANSGLNPEPYAFETAFAVKWMIEKQISGAGDLNYDPAKGAVVAPWLSWGPYLWTDGTVARSDGFTWVCPDYLENDYTHPNTNGVAQVARQLLAFFKTDPTTMPWFLKKTSPPFTVSASANVTNGVAPLTVNFSASSTPGTNMAQFVWTFDDGTFAFGPIPTKVFSAPGHYLARLTASDTGGNTAQATVAIAVNTTVAAWKNARFATNELSNPGISGDMANPDGDSFPNLLEYAMGLDPKNAEETAVGMFIQNGNLILNVPHFKAATDVSLRVESSAAWNGWVPVIPAQTNDLGPSETWVIQEPVSSSAARFFRITAARLP